VVARFRQVHGVDRVMVRDNDAIEALLELNQLGAAEGVLAWQERQPHRQVQATARTIANFDSPNQRRSASASAAAARSGAGAVSGA